MRGRGRVMEKDVETEGETECEGVLRRSGGSWCLKKKKKRVRHASLADADGKTDTETTLCIKSPLMPGRWPRCLTVCGTTETWF